MAESVTARGGTRRRPVVLYQPREGGAAMPLGLLALGSCLEGRHVVIVDGRFELAPEARVVELARSALLLWVEVRTGEPLLEALRVTRAARAASPQLPVIWGGSHALVDPASCLATGVVDACAPGAGEEPLQAAVTALRSGRGLGEVPGLQVSGGAPSPATPAPTRLWPRADYSLLNVERYFEEHGARRLDYCSSRGARDGPEWLGLRAERVVGEALELAERYQVQELCFRDDDFFADGERVVKIAEALSEAAARLPWRAEARTSDVLEASPDALKLLRRSGCAGLQLRVRSADLARVHEAGARLAAARLGGRFVFEVDEADGRSGLATAVAAARRLCAMDPRFATPIRKAPAVTQPGRQLSLDGWAALERAPWRDAAAETRLARAAFYFAEAQRPPGRRLGKHLLRVLSLLRVRLGFFELDFERAAVELSAMVRTGRARALPGD
jgi:hypothetical protein